MHKQTQQGRLYFRTVLYTREEIISAADFQAIDKYVLSGLKTGARVFKVALKLPRELYIQPLEFKQAVFQLQELPAARQRNAVAVLLTRFRFISPKLMQTIVNGKDNYINITYVQYPHGMYRTLIALEHWSRARRQAAKTEEQLAENRHAEKQFLPAARTRRLRAKPRKLLRDYQALELVEKENF
ncbi:MAG: hypothetical protein LBQ83_07560 [Candidatus Margulisbacteria bacterium]|jgi:hypothetical protein|nr:hypothetical protein [Candidatus Margulisiibacteriota bacterium]